MTKPPSMTRSRNQLASAYAPGSLFTFEGGVGACVARVDASIRYYESRIAETTKRQIIQRIDDIAATWLRRAIACRDDNPDPMHTIAADLCVDDEFINPTDRRQTQPLSHGRVFFVDPLRMSYEPAPLSFQCQHCKLLRYFDRVADAAHHVSELNRASCPHPKKPERCDWQQLDVVHVHWSGEWAAPQPGRFDWNQESEEVRLIGDRCCGQQDFILDNSSPSIGKWSFKCAHCHNVLGDGRWIQRDKFTISQLGARYSQRVRDAAMEATSYRASAAYYSQSDMFILFDQENEDRLRILEPDRQLELEAFIGEQYGFTGPAVSDEELQVRLTAAGREDLWKKLHVKRRTLDIYRGMPDSADAITVVQQEIADLRKEIFHGPTKVLDAPPSLPTSVQGLLLQRASAGSRFDSFRLALEHRILSDSTLRRPRDEYGRRRFVPFVDPDRDLCPSSDERALRRIGAATARAQQRLHFAQFGLVREFDLCRFSFGYTRVSALPVVERHDTRMPVRLKLFDTVPHPDGGQCHPIYVITQSNEAIYVQLNEQAVFDWLVRNGASGGIEWNLRDPVKLGGHLLAHAQIFGRFVDNIATGTPSPYIYTYTLLHTLAHAMMKTIASNSGLDVGSLGEYIFPTDLAFVVYRSGTTMDLGNLSALWRNQNERFLAALLESRTWACNSGSLCAEKGGACPDCLLVPETSCIAQNHLLCRSVVRGGLAPHEDDRGVLISGFLND